MPRAVVLLQPGAADWEAGHLLACLREYLGFEVVTATPDGTGIVTIGGLRVMPETSYDTVDLDQPDLVVLIGSGAWREFRDPHLFGRLKRRVDAARPTGAICAATLALARAGVLDGRPHTSNAASFLREEAAEGYGGAAFYDDGPRAVSDGVVITASGAAPVTFALECMRAVGADPKVVDGFWQMARAEFGG